MNKLRSLGFAAGLTAFGAGLGNLTHTELELLELATTPGSHGEASTTSLVGKLMGVKAKERFENDVRVVEIRDGESMEIRPTKTAVEDLRTEFGDIILAALGACAAIVFSSPGKQ